MPIDKGLAWINPSLLHSLLYIKIPTTTFNRLILACYTGSSILKCQQVKVLHGLILVCYTGFSTIKCRQTKILHGLILACCTESSALKCRQTKILHGLTLAGYTRSSTLKHCWQAVAQSAFCYDWLNSHRWCSCPKRSGLLLNFHLVFCFIFIWSSASFPSGLLVC